MARRCLSLKLRSANAIWSSSLASAVWEAQFLNGGGKTWRCFCCFLNPLHPTQGCVESKDRPWPNQSLTGSQVGRPGFSTRPWPRQSLPFPPFVFHFFGPCQLISITIWNGQSTFLATTVSMVLKIGKAAFSSSKQKRALTIDSWALLLEYVARYVREEINNRINPDVCVCMCLNVNEFKAGLQKSCHEAMVTLTSDSSSFSTNWTGRARPGQKNNKLLNKEDLGMPITAIPLLWSGVDPSPDKKSYLLASGFEFLLPLLFVLVQPELTKKSSIERCIARRAFCQIQSKPRQIAQGQRHTWRECTWYQSVAASLSLGQVVVQNYLTHCHALLDLKKRRPNMPKNH